MASEKNQLLPPLAQKLQNQKNNKKNYHGLYDYVVINLTYSSNRMASNRLTRKHVEMIFRKGKVSDMFEPVKVSDIIEVMNHCVCMDYILGHPMEPLSITCIQKYHEILTYGTVDARLVHVVPGEFRTGSSERNEDFIKPARNISGSLKALIKRYEAKSNVDIADILDFHVQFERIFPFDDYNGRVGRLIMFKECLMHGVVPFILDDKHRSQYLDGLRKWDVERDVLISVVKEAQDKFEHQVSQHKLLAQGRKFLPKDFEEE